MRERLAALAPRRVLSIRAYGSRRHGQSFQQCIAHFRSQPLCHHGRMEAGGTNHGTRPTRAGSFCRDAAWSQRWAGVLTDAPEVAARLRRPKDPCHRPNSRSTSSWSISWPALASVSPRSILARKTRRSMASSIVASGGNRSATSRIRSFVVRTQQGSVCRLPCRAPCPSAYPVRARTCGCAGRAPAKLGAALAA